MLRLSQATPRRRAHAVVLSAAIAAATILPVGASAGAATGTGTDAAASPATVPAHPPREARILIPDTPLHPHAAAGLALRYAGTPVDVLAYHVDDARTGWNAAETALTPATVASSKFGVLATLNVDGDVFAQPLLVNGVRMADGKLHDVLVVVTSNNSVYAFDAQSYAVLWTVNFGHPQLAADIGCTDNPQYGITATPVVQRKGGRAHLYVVDAVEPSTGDFHTHLHRIDLASGADVNPPVEIYPSALLSDGSTLSFDPVSQWARAGLVSHNGSVYVSIGSHCDNNVTRTAGWLLRYAADLTLQAKFNTIKQPQGGAIQLASIWMSGFAPAIDTDGSVFAITGNGAFTRAGKDWGMSVIRLDGIDHHVLDYFTPSNEDYLSQRDLDFGSAGVMLIPDQPGQLAPPLATAMGKDGKIWLLNRSRLGHQRSDDGGALQSIQVQPMGWIFFGGPAYWMSPTGGMVYYQVNNDVLRGFAVSTGATPSLTQTLTGTSLGAMGGSIPIVTSNGSQAGTGVVWLIRRNPLQLEAYDAEHLGAPIYTASPGAWTAGRPYLVPMAANGRVYVGASGTVTVFGLTP
jgi:hypothetical protein